MHERKVYLDSNLQLQGKNFFIFKLTIFDPEIMGKPHAGKNLRLFFRFFFPQDKIGLHVSHELWNS